jgi:chemotaxis protein methyltransferase CheR
MEMLTSQQFDRARCLASRLAGIELSERHREVLARRGQRLGIAGGAALDSLLDAVESGTLTAKLQFLGLLTTKFTGFFRHPRHFDLAVEKVKQAVEKAGRARVWSAAAATGEEPYSMAMRIMEAFPQADIPVSIVATDIDAAALAKAQAGEYSDLSVRAIEPERRARFFEATGSDHRWVLLAEVRRLVEWRELNLVQPVWPVEGPFDIIFCRNVLMYLEAGRRVSVLERMSALLAGDGLLVLDPAEHLGRADGLFTGSGEGVYSRSSRPCRGKHIIHDAPCSRGPNL